MRAARTPTSSRIAATRRRRTSAAAGSSISSSEKPDHPPYHTDMESPAPDAPVPTKLPPARERVGPINDSLKRLYAEGFDGLTHASPLQLVVATILSAQCTDARVNLVTP